jgi:hypothetical protein
MPAVLTPTATQMAKTPAAVERMTRQLREKAYPAAQRELGELQAFVDQHAQEEPGTTTTTPLRHWDLAYWSEKRREALFSVSDEEVKPFLPLPAVLGGMFTLAERLFGVSLVPSKVRIRASSSSARPLCLWVPCVTTSVRLDRATEERGRPAGPARGLARRCDLVRRAERPDRRAPRRMFPRPLRPPR